ncbi:hypothetical protein DL764_005015 [Monosporascus ibericus]|uniref:Uncharacterized protein n=1 Tax=Monosporascus ibericus TaxID=155417 RepID=A0A4Q4TAK6_9PEZI|nr:hypothetical protein DL764_005015 [Monosporascus ibericus]
MPGEIGPREIEPMVVDGEAYMPLPHEVYPELPEDYVWSQRPPHPAFLEDPDWYDALGQDLVKQRRIRARDSESEQVEEFRRLLAERPDRGLDMLFGAAVKGKAHVVRFLLGAGVRPTADKGGADDGSLAPLYAAAFHGHGECVEILAAGREARAEVVRLLIDAGADIFVRQKKAADSDEDGDDEEHADVAEEGANAFELAALGGSIECAELVVGRAEQLGTPRAELVTALTLASAARSDGLDVLGFVLDTGGFPRPPAGGEGGGGAWDTDALTDGMKEKIEKAFARKLRAGKHKALRPLFAYIGDSRRKASAAAADGGKPQPYWTSLSDETLATPPPGAGDPVEFLDEAVRADKGDARAVVAATHGREVLRAPVRILSEDAWRRERGGDGLQEERGSTWDEERNEVYYVVIRLEKADAAWWSTRLQIRKNDEELAAMEKGREVSNGTPRPITT